MGSCNGGSSPLLTHLKFLLQLINMPIGILLVDLFILEIHSPLWLNS